MLVLIGGSRTKVLFESVDVEGGLLRFRHSEALRAVVNSDLFFDYGPGIDLSRVPMPVLWASGIYNVAAAVWLLGVTATVPFRHAPMEQGLEKIQAWFRQMYPSVPWHGRLVFEGDEAPAAAPTDGAVAMFSGGLDSMHTVYRHIDERPTIVRLISPAMSPALKAASFEQGMEFAAQHGLGFVTAVTNINNFLRGSRLLFPDLVRRRKPWWVSVQYGMGTPAAAAPIAYLRNAGRVYLASTLSPGYGRDKPFASQPAIDDNVAWPGARVIHDAFEFSRQQKVQDLVRYCSAGMPKPKLRPCNYPVDGLNCGKCEKCLRTMSGLIVEGEAPRDWGFDVDRDEAIGRVRRAFEQAKLWILEDGVFYWNEVRQAAASSKRCPPEFARWLAALDLEPIYRRSRRKRWVRTMAGKFIPPALMAATRPLVEAIYPRARRKPVL
jgi:hypothetical protein